MKLYVIEYTWRNNGEYEDYYVNQNEFAGVFDSLDGAKSYVYGVIGKLEASYSVLEYEIERPVEVNEDGTIHIRFSSGDPDTDFYWFDNDIAIREVACNCGHLELQEVK